MHSRRLVRIKIYLQDQAAKFITLSVLLVFYIVKYISRSNIKYLLNKRVHINTQTSVFINIGMTIAEVRIFPLELKIIEGLLHAK